MIKATIALLAGFTLALLVGLGILVLSLWIADRMDTLTRSEQPCYNLDAGQNTEPRPGRGPYGTTG